MWPGPCWDERLESILGRKSRRIHERTGRSERTMLSPLETLAALLGSSLYEDPRRQGVDVRDAHYLVMLIGYDA